MKIQIFIIIILIFSTELSIAQTSDEPIRIEVLQKNKIGKKFTYGKWTENGGTETELTYLGTLKEYKILNSRWIWGMSKRATNRIIIFDSKNKYIGNYYVTATCDLPNRIENNNLIFNRSDCEDCDNTENKIEFERGIPEQIFINCKGKDGDLYSFDRTLIE
jgi:hypothetical protein